MNCRELSETFIEPDLVEFSKIPVRELSKKWQVFIDEMMDYAHRIAAQNGADIMYPKNETLADIHHVNMLTQVACAKDSFTKWLIAVTADIKQKPPQDTFAASSDAMTVVDGDE